MRKESFQQLMHISSDAKHMKRKSVSVFSSDLFRIRRDLNRSRVSMIFRCLALSPSLALSRGLFRFLPSILTIRLCNQRSMSWWVTSTTTATMSWFDLLLLFLFLLLSLSLSFVSLFSFSLIFVEQSQSDKLPPPLSLSQSLCSSNIQNILLSIQQLGKGIEKEDARCSILIRRDASSTTTTKMMKMMISFL